MKIPSARSLDVDIDTSKIAELAESWALLADDLSYSWHSS
jgi:hypothetical protein